MEHRNRKVGWQGSLFGVLLIQLVYASYEWVDYGTDEEPSPGK
jgi:hypothetical protein